MIYRRQRALRSANPGSIFIGLLFVLAGCGEDGSPDAGGPDLGMRAGADATASVDAEGPRDARAADSAIADAGAIPDADLIDAGPDADATGMDHFHADFGEPQDSSTHEHDAGSGQRGIRVGGQCFEICQTDSDPDPSGVRDGWGWENQASCVMPYNPLADSEPFCDTPPSWPPYAPPPSTVDETTTSVAVLPRPVVVAEPVPTNCPHDQSGLVRWDPSWIDSSGVARVPDGTRALIDGNDDIPENTLIRELTIPPQSELIFADRDTSLRLTDLRVQGTLRLGSPSCRLASSIEIVFDTDEDLTDPSVLEAIHNRAGLGLVVEPGGTLEVFGQLYQPTWTRLAETAMPGATSLTLQESVDWEPGQSIVLVTGRTHDYPYTDENEVLTIAQVVGGTTVQLAGVVAYRHYGGPEYQVEVGLLSRSIVFRTNDGLALSAPTFGGHVLAMGEARVSGLEVRGLGQQNFLGRYPLHLHHAGDVAGNSYFTDNSIWESNWRCAVLHRTDNALISRNVAFDVFGHCFYLEDGVEMGNEISFNLAAGVKIMGPVDQASVDALNTYGQEGFTLIESPEFSNPADRAAAGFYITNGNNYVIGNAASGGFAGYSLPNLPEALGGSADRVLPINYGMSHFDGNSAHSAGYFWDKGGCIYAGGILEVVDVNGQPRLRYQSGRPQWDQQRAGLDVFTNSKTFLCTIGVTHWGRESRSVNLESWDNLLLAQVFGKASIQSAIVAGSTANSATLGFDPRMVPFRRGFQFYDTGTQTILRSVVFRGFRPDPGAGSPRSWNNCAIYTMVHSNQYTPQRMNATAELYFSDTDDTVRFCNDDSGTLASRNFNLIDHDGTATALAGDGLPPGPRLVGSAFSDVWSLSPSCPVNNAWGLQMCPLAGNHNVASIGVRPNQGVVVTVYDLMSGGGAGGDNWYSRNDEFFEAQISAPSGLGWHHSFGGSVPETIEVRALQVPVDSFVLWSMTLPPGVSCSVSQAGWLPAVDVAELLMSTGPAYTTLDDTCFVRIPYTDTGSFDAAGLSIPNQAWLGFSATTDFTIITGCSSSIPECGMLVSRLPAF